MIFQFPEKFNPSVMPEGPTIVILKEAVQPFIGKEIRHAEGNTKNIDISNLQGLKIIDFKSWGKHFLICLPDYTIRVHFMMFGSYLINLRKSMPPRLSLQFSNGELNLYACSIIRIEESLNKIYDWSADVMNPQWDREKAIQKLKKYPAKLVCDALLDQHIFSGVGNIIKNEVLFRIRIHPESAVGLLPSAKLSELVDEAVKYSFQFLEWKKEFTLKKHWLAHNKTICPRDHVPFHKKKLGKTMRRSFFCPICQKLYDSQPINLFN
jgi:endonuclease-8